MIKDVTDRFFEPIDEKPGAETEESLDQQIEQDQDWSDALIAEYLKDNKDNKKETK